jgi:Ca-activated chloride channel family protein
MKLVSRLQVCLWTLVGAVLIALPAASQQKPKQPKPRQLDAGVQLERDPATSELRMHSAGASSPPREATGGVHAIRVKVNLVEVGANVIRADGDPARGLTGDDFRLFEDHAEQKITYFDASTRPTHIALVIDASPSVLRESEDMKHSASMLVEALAPQDEVAVAEFSAHTYLLLPFSSDRAAPEQAIASVDVRKLFPDTGGSNIYEAVYLVASELFRDRTGRKAIIVLTDGQDSGLGLSWDPASMQPRPGAQYNRLTFEDVARKLAAEGVELYVISTQNRPRAMTAEWLASHQDETLITPHARELGMPHYTLFLAEMVRRAGGQIYFLRELGTLGEAYRRIAESLRTQYTLGYYPSAGAGQPGWHSLNVELKNSPGARVIHRVSYYVPAGS